MQARLLCVTVVTTLPEGKIRHPYCSAKISLQYAVLVWLGSHAAFSSVQSPSPTQPVKLDFARAESFIPVLVDESKSW